MISLPPAAGGLGPKAAVTNETGVRGRWPGLPPRRSLGPSPGDIRAGRGQGGQRG